MIWTVSALLAGVVVVLGLAQLAIPLAEQTDDSMVWEGRVAVGFAALAFIGPVWLAQGILTLVATFSDGGLFWPGWLWVWFAAAPLLGVSPPATALARAVQRALAGHSPQHHRNAAAVQHEANVAWSDTAAEPEWQLRRTPPLPESWPPVAGGPAVWLCYAERPAADRAVEVAAPWAQITLGSGQDEWPTVQRLAAVVESLGLQSPSAATQLVGLLEGLYRGDPRGRLAEALGDWGRRNPVIAAHPSVAGHLPPH